MTDTFVSMARAGQPLAGHCAGAAVGVRLQHRRPLHPPDRDRRLDHAVLARPVRRPADCRLRRVARRSGWPWPPCAASAGPAWSRPAARPRPPSASSTRCARPSVADVLVINATGAVHDGGHGLGVDAACASGAPRCWPAAWRCWASSSYWSCRRWVPAACWATALALAVTVLISAMMVVMRHHRDVCMLPRRRAVGLPVRPRSCGRGRRPAAVTGWTRLRLAGPVRHDAVRPRPAACSPSALRSVSATRSALIGALETPLAPAIVSGWSWARCRRS